jgi:hypothetical protein
MGNRRFLSALVAGLCVGFGAHAAPASLIGDTVTLTYRFDLGVYTDVIVVGDGVEVNCNGTSSLNVCGILNGSYSLDIGSDTIRFLQSVPQPTNYVEWLFNGWEISGLDFGGGITGVELASTGLTGLDAPSDLAFTPNTISLNLSGVLVATESGWTMTLAGSPSPVPAPPALPLAAVALAALATFSRRRVG